MDFLSADFSIYLFTFRFFNVAVTIGQMTIGQMDFGQFTFQLLTIQQMLI